MNSSRSLTLGTCKREPGTEQTRVLVLNTTLVESPKTHTFKLEQQRELMFVGYQLETGCLPHVTLFNLIFVCKYLERQE